jgi:cell filamentation protein
MTSDPYVYPGTNTLRNRYGVRDADQLARLDADLSARRLAELAVRPIPGRYDLPHLRAFHRHIFGDLYPWAGQVRTVAIAKGDLFALPQHIKPYLSNVLSRLPDEDYLQGLEPAAVIDRLTFYLAEINSVHPFREGNGRTQRAFIGQLARQVGYRMAWERLDRERNIQASQAAHHGDLEPLRALLANLTERA